jgi:hypothetical protein
MSPPAAGPPAQAHFGTPAQGNVAFPTPNAGIPQAPPRSQGGGGNKGMLLGAAGVIGLLSVGAIVFALKGSGSSSGGPGLVFDAGPAATVTDLTTPSATAAPSTAPAESNDPGLAPLATSHNSNPPVPAAHHDGGAGPHPGTTPTTPPATPTTPPAGGGEPVECAKARAMRAAGNIPLFQALAKQCEAHGGHV